MSRQPKSTDRNAARAEVYAAVKGGYWTCPACGERCPEVHSVCRDCGQPVRHSEALKEATTPGSPPKENRGSGPRNIGLIFIIFIFAGVVGKQILWPLTTQSLRRSDAGQILSLADIPVLCDQVNRELPMVINDLFVWDRLVPNEFGATMQLHLSQHTLHEIAVDAFCAEMKAVVSRKLRSDPTMSRIFSSGLSVKCEYTDKNGSYVCSFVVGSR